MKILITGGAGFIGSQLGIYLMRKKHQVTFLDNLRFGYKENLRSQTKLKPTFILMDVRDPQLKKVCKGMDVIFHLAGISSLPECQNNPQEAYAVNVTGTANVLEAARANNIKRVIFSSTSAVYENTTIFPTDEEQNIQPQLIYSLTKKHAEDLCQSYKLLYNMDIVILRFFNVYGPHMDFKRPNPPFISYIIHCFLHNKTPLLHSNGNQSRDMIYIDDVLRLLEIVLDKKSAKNRIFNVGSGTSVSVMRVYDEIASVMHKQHIKPIFRNALLLWEKYPNIFGDPYPLKATYLEREVNKYTLASIKKAKKLLGWSPKIVLSQGIRSTIEFAKNN